MHYTDNNIVYNNIINVSSIMWSFKVFVLIRNNETHSKAFNDVSSLYFQYQNACDSFR